MAKLHAVKNEFLFGTVIRTTFEVYLEVFFAAVLNLNDRGLANSTQVYSAVVAVLWFVLLNVVLLVVAGAWCWFPKDYTQESVSGSRLAVLLRDFKDGKRACLLEHVLFILRRQLLVYLIVFGWQHGLLQIISFVIVSVITLLAKIWVRPYKSVLIGAQDIVFEALLCTVLVISIAFGSRSSEMVKLGAYHTLGVACFSIVSAPLALFAFRLSI